MLRRCLAKDPKRRWQSVADLRIEIETILADPDGLSVEAAEQARRNTAVEICDVSCSGCRPCSWDLQLFPLEALTAGRSHTILYTAERR